MKRKIPSDINTDFKEAWEAFTELPATKKLDEKVLSECFRILLTQAGSRTKCLYSLRNFFSVNKRYTEFSNALHSKFLLYHLVPQKHTFDIEIESDDLTNVAKRFIVRGNARLKAQRFSLNHLLDRMASIKVLKEVPKSLKLTASKATKDGKATTVYKDRHPSKVRDVKEWDKVSVALGRDYKISIARLKSDNLAMFYEVYFDVELPNYPDLKQTLFAVWRQASIGDLQ
ncbi:hypothetical protein D3C80_509690 [compost metagenome]